MDSQYLKFEEEVINFFKSGQKKPTRMVYNTETKFMEYRVEPFNEGEIRSLFESRMSICQSCEKLTWKKDIPTCGACGCGLPFKISVIYPLDEEGKAIRLIFPNGEKHYMCKLGKW